MEGPFFLVTQFDSRLQRTQTVLTVRSTDVVSAEIQKDGVTIAVVLGAGLIKKK